MPTTTRPQPTRPDPPLAGVTGRLFGVVARPFQAFLALQAASGILLLACAVAALVWANVDPASYRAAFAYPISLGAGDARADFTVGALIDDGLMAIFFFVVGMEIKRELVTGELDSLAKASLPAIAAVGGMVLPAAIFLAATWSSPGRHGWGVPMATDIAFCVGLLTLLKGRVPHALVVFVTALAIFDDIGGILVIAFFYGDGLDLRWLAVAGGLLLVLYGMGRVRLVHGLAYAVMGVGLWYALHHAGIHAAIAGVLLGLMIPARPPRASRAVLRELADHVAALDRKPPDEELDGAEVVAIEAKLEDLQAPVQRFVHLLHPFVAFVIMPLFALANAGVSLRGGGVGALLAPVTVGVAAGLLVGKAAGIFALTWLAVRLGLAPMPGGATGRQLLGVSILAGIGFTVALFIATLAFPHDEGLRAHAKLGILIGSFAAGLIGYLVLRLGAASRSSTGTHAGTQ